MKTTNAHEQIKVAYIFIYIFFSIVFLNPYTAVHPVEIGTVKEQE
jgi:hypothetical protein